MTVVKNIYDVANMHAPFTGNKLFEDEKGAVVVEIIWWLDLQLPMQSVYITTKVMSLNPTHGEVYSIQHDS